MIVDLFVDTLVRWLMVLAIPFLVYKISFSKEISFWGFVGLKKAGKVKPRTLLIVSILSVIYLLMNLFFIKNYQSGINDMRYLSFKESGFSVQTIIVLVINSIILTSLVEELFFRGFLINVFKKKFSFTYANQIQAILFTLINTVGAIIMKVSTVSMIISVISIYALSFYFGKMTKEAEGSILYSALFYGLINLITGIALMLML